MADDPTRYLDVSGVLALKAGSTVDVDYTVTHAKSVAARIREYAAGIDGAVSSAAGSVVADAEAAVSLIADQAQAAAVRAQAEAERAEAAAGEASSYVIVGPGRPDQPSTTAGTITGSEPVGAEYRSTDGAQVGAYVWMKRPGGQWAVTSGNTGWRNVASLLTAGSALSVGLIRQGDLVTLSLTQWRQEATDLTPTILTLPPGCRPSRDIFRGPFPAQAAGSVALIDVRTSGTVMAVSPGQNVSRYLHLPFSTSDSWPSAPLPGTPA